MIKIFKPTPTPWSHWAIGLHPYIIGDEFMNSVEKIKTLYISGFLGGGKTMLAYFLAAHAMANGWTDRIISNIPSPLSITAEDVETVNNSSIILDEAWQFMSERSEAVQYGAALRKLGIILLMPSVFPPSAVLSAFSCQRFLNGYIFGVPVWGYNYFMNYKSFRDKGTFWFVNPHLVAGWYDTEAYPAEDYGIARKLDTAVEILKVKTAQKLGKTRKAKNVEKIAVNENKNQDAGIQVANIPQTIKIDTTALEGVGERIDDASQRMADAVARLKKR